jgi:hypothetical protein
MSLPNQRPPDSPFAPGELDAHQVTQIDPVIAALPDAEAEKALDGLIEALKEKRSLKQFKEGLQAVANVAKKFGVGL